LAPGAAGDVELAVDQAEEELIRPAAGEAARGDGLRAPARDRADPGGHGQLLTQARRGLGARTLQPGLAAQVHSTAVPPGDPRARSVHGAVIRARRAIDGAID